MSEQLQVTCINCYDSQHKMQLQPIYTLQIKRISNQLNKAVFISSK